MPWASSSMLDTVRRVNCCETCCKKLSDKSKQVLFWGPASEYKGAKKPHFAPWRQPYTTLGKPSSYLSDSFRRIILGNPGAGNKVLSETHKNCRVRRLSVIREPKSHIRLRRSATHTSAISVLLGPPVVTRKAEQHRR